MAVPGQSAGESRDTAAGTMEFPRHDGIGVEDQFGSSLNTRLRAGNIWRSASALLVFIMAGCGAQYRPVVNPVRPTGPSPAPTAYAVAITQPDGTEAGVATVLDFSGDTVLAQATIGNLPLDFTLDIAGATAYTIDRDGSLSDIPISTSLQTKNVLTSTLTANSVPINTTSGTGNLYVVDASSNQIDVLTGSPPGLKQALQLPVGLINMAGRSASSRFYAISQLVGTPGVASPCANPASVTTNGVASALETSTFSISATIPVGICPVYGLQSADGLRTFILNRGSGTVTVIDTQKNALDTQFNPSATFTLPAGPVYGELYDTTSQLVTANYDSNTISVIDVSTDTFDNDSPQFGTIHNVPVGNGPSSVTVLQDGSRAYVANSKDGTISIVNLSTYTVEKTIVLPVNQDGTTPHPRMVASSYNFPTGKIYVTSPDSENLVILRTDTDTVSTTLQLQGNLIDVRITRQNANASSQINNNSYSPGNGVPCTPGTVPTQLSTNPTACQLENPTP
ncbi:YncE family protein [Acidisarcina polymorpha]|nr:YncE family protein [Acidisarcina polymorpha]